MAYLSRRSKQSARTDAKTEARGKLQDNIGTSTHVEVADCLGVGRKPEDGKSVETEDEFRYAKFDFPHAERA